MVNWLKKQARDVEGNAKWDFLKWVYHLGLGTKVGALVSPIILSALFYLFSLPQQVIVILAMCFVLILFVIVTATYKVQKKQAPSLIETTTGPLMELSRELTLELVPHGNNRTALCLEVNNKGDEVKITVTVRLLSRSYGGPVDTLPYTGRWALLSFKRRFSDHRPPPTASVVTIPSGGHRVLEIAKMDLENDSNDISAAYLIGSKECLRWDFEQKSGDKLPFFRMRLEFSAEGIAKSLSKTYDVGPKHAYGPLGMTEVTT